jgi:hypothetical protein
MAIDLFNIIFLSILIYSYRASVLFIIVSLCITIFSNITPLLNKDVLFYFYLFYAIWDALRGSLYTKV